MAVAYRWLMRVDRASGILNRLRETQIGTGPAEGAIPAASECPLPTGIDLDLMDRSSAELKFLGLPHVGSTAWFIIAELGINPYFVEESKMLAGR